MTISVLNPLTDSRWDDLVACHPRSSVFHQRGWLEALARTYGYEPHVLTSSPPGEPLRDGIVLCRVSSWVTGSRLVSLPFADHCDPLLDDDALSQDFIDWLRADCDDRGQRYLELRPLLGVRGGGLGLHPSRTYWFHELDLRPSLDEIYRRLHKNSFRRKIRRAQREGITYESGNSEEIVGEFYHLLLSTRRRHRLLPQPRIWFKNLVSCLSDAVQIRLAKRNGEPIAAILSLQHRSTVVYKYGCSDAAFHRLGGMPFLFWKLIEESKGCGAERIDFGRSDLGNQGLITFKDRMGTARKLLTYYRYASQATEESVDGAGSLNFGSFLSLLPNVVLSTAGRMLYKHMG